LTPIILNFAKVKIHSKPQVYEKVHINRPNNSLRYPAGAGCGEFL
jgi:hypothetical protein